MVEDRAREAGCGIIRLTTTNDNTDALRFYQRRGFEVTAWHGGGFRDKLRMNGLNPNTTVTGCHDIMIRDIVVLRKELS